jgi:hypothetical protein
MIKQINREILLLKLFRPKFLEKNETHVYAERKFSAGFREISTKVIFVLL